MIPHVIEDSDEESDALSPVRSRSAELRGPIGAAIGTADVGGTESTDPVLFQEVYEKYRTAALEPLSEAPALDDPIINQRMSSSPLPSGARKRSKSLHVSSLTSLTEPTVSNRLKRTNTTNVDDLTQVTSPRNSKDIWDIPSSAEDIVGGVRSRNVAKLAEKTVKTYGRNKQSKLAAPHSSNPEVWDESVELLNARKRTAPDSPDTPEMKRQKQVHATQSSDIYGISADKSPADRAVGEYIPDFAGISNYSQRNTSGSSVKIQVPRSTSDQSRQALGSPHKRIGSSIVTGTQSLPAIAETPVGNQAAPENSYVTETTEKATSSISIVPTAFTPSQKLQYPAIDPTSSDLSRRSSVAEDLLQAETEEGMVATSTNLTDIPRNCSPELPEMSNRDPEKVTQASISLTAPQPPVAKKQKVRSKTLDARSHRDSSYDELSLDSNTHSSRVSRDKAPTRRKGAKDDNERVSIDDIFGSDEIGMPAELYKPRPSSRRTKSVGVSESAVSIDLDKLLSSLPKAKRKSDKRKIVEEEEEEEAIVVSKRPSKNVDQGDEEMHTSFVEEYNNPSQEHAEITKATTIEANNAASESIEEPEEPEEPVEAAPCPATKRGRPRKKYAMAEVMETPAAPKESLTQSTNVGQPAPRSRGRPKKQKSATSEIMETQEVSTNKASPEAEAQASPELGEKRRGSTSLGESMRSKDEHRDVLVDRNDNSYSTPAATPTKPGESTGIIEPLRTPTKEVMKKGPDQHSPLKRDSRVVYRVGLSKKRKIAPLLKIIRK